MAKREDGKETRWKLLNAACEMFAQKGYRDARVADICKRAGANVASVNYYFGDKASLYREAWRHALQQFEELLYAESDVDSPPDALREYIRTLMQHLSSKSDLSQFSRLYLMELIHPTGLIQDDWLERVEPRRRRLHEIIRAIAGAQTEELSILFCELSIINQCRVLVTSKGRDLEYMLGQSLSPELIDRMANHIAEFSLAGIAAVGKHATR